MAAAAALVVILGAAYLSGGQPRANTHPVLDDVAAQEIQALLSGHVLALSQLNDSAYAQSVDRTTVAFARCMDEFFELGPVRAEALEPFRLIATESVNSSLARAFVRQRDGVGVVYVRWLREPAGTEDNDFRWRISQPRFDELGERRERVVEGLTVSYFELDELHSELVARALADARDFALSLAPRVPSGELAGRFEPAREVISGITCPYSGRYYHEADQVAIWRYLLDESLEQLAPTTRALLRHEALHWIQWHFTNMTPVDWWLHEGWAVLRSGEPLDPDLLRSEICSEDRDQLPTVAELQNGPVQGTSVRRTLVLYVSAHSLMSFAYEMGADDASYWELVAALSGGADRGTAYSRSLGMSLVDLHAQWVGRARDRYC